MTFVRQPTRAGVRDAADKLFREWGPKFATRPGGYTRTHGLQPDDGLYLAEVRSGPVNLKQLTDALESEGHVDLAARKLDPDHDTLSLVLLDLVMPDLRFLELGRSCVLKPYRTKRTVELLWHGIWTYVLHHRIDAMIGCASLEGTDPDKLALPLSFLHHYAAAPPPWLAQIMGVPAHSLAKFEADMEEIEP